MCTLSCVNAPVVDDSCAHYAFFCRYLRYSSVVTVSSTTSPWNTIFWRKRLWIIASVHSWKALYTISTVLLWYHAPFIAKCGSPVQRSSIYDISLWCISVQTIRLLPTTLKNLSYFSQKVNPIMSKKKLLKRHWEFNSVTLWLQTGGSLLHHKKILFGKLIGRNPDSVDNLGEKCFSVENTFLWRSIWE